MPRVARYRIAVIDDLARQLRFAPPATRLRQMSNAEQLLRDLDPAQNYPASFVIFRVTGYRPDDDSPATLVGEALVGDLVNLIQQLSWDLELAPDHAGRRALSMREAAARLNVSQKTLQRYRRHGLVCHYVLLRPDLKQLACFEDAIDAFANLHRAQIDRAAEYSRIDWRLRQQIIEEARELRRARRVSLNRAASILARKHKRAHETIRILLQKHDRESDEPIFTERGPLQPREIRLVFRAWRFGVKPGVLAARLGRTNATIHRAINRRRRELLQRIDLQVQMLPTFTLPEAAQVILSGRDVREDLHLPLPQHDALAFAADARGAVEIKDDAIDAMTAAMNFLKYRARQLLESLPMYPASAALDEIETDLRWSMLLKRRLVAAMLPIAIVRIEANLNRPVVELPRDAMRKLLQLGVDTLAAAVDRFNPAKRQRLAGVCTLALDRALAAIELPRDRERAAAARSVDRAVPLLDPLQTLDPSLAWLRLRPDLQPFVNELDDLHQQAMMQRFGLGGEPPMTINAMARNMESTPTAVTRLLRRAERRLRHLAVRHEGDRIQ